MPLGLPYPPVRTNVWGRPVWVDRGVYKCRVMDNRDSSKQGKLRVENPTIFPGGPCWVRGATPISDAGGGFFHAPIPGTEVLVVPVTRSEPGQDAPEYVWIACLWDDTGEVRAENYEMDAGEDKESGMRHRTSIPEVDKIYAVDGVPAKAIWKTVAGHKIEMSSKEVKGKADELVQEDHILIENRTGQRILLDQGSGKENDRIVITDGDNIIRIQRTDDGKIGENSLQIECIGNMYLTAKQGQMYLHVTEDSDSDIKIQNEGTGNVDIMCMQGELNLYAKKKLNIVSDEAINIMAPTIDLNP